MSNETVVPPHNIKDLKDANILVPDTTAHPQGFGGELELFRQQIGDRHNINQVPDWCSISYCKKLCTFFYIYTNYEGVRTGRFNDERSKSHRSLNASSTLFISSVFPCYLCFLPYIFPFTYIRVVSFLFTFFPICHSDVLKIQNTHFSSRLRPFSVSPKLSFDV